MRRTLVGGIIMDKKNAKIFGEQLGDSVDDEAANDALCKQLVECCVFHPEELKNNNIKNNFLREVLFNAGPRAIEQFIAYLDSEKNKKPAGGLKEAAVGALNLAVKAQTRQKKQATVFIIEETGIFPSPEVSVEYGKVKLDVSEDEKKIRRYIDNHKLKEKYKKAKIGSNEYIKLDFISHFNFDRYQNLDQFVNERVGQLNDVKGIDYNKYKQALISSDTIFGFRGFKKTDIMKNLVESIQPGWSASAPPGVASMQNKEEDVVVRKPEAKSKL